MIGLVVATHSRLAEELLLTAETIVGQLPNARAVAIFREDGGEIVQERLSAAISAVDCDGDGVIVMTDMFGGTPTNIAMNLYETHNIEVLTGVNLPMVVKCCSSLKGKDLPTVAGLLREYGQRAIMCPGELLKYRTEPVAE